MSVTAFYEAFILYMIGLNETLEAGLEHDDGEVMKRFLWNRTFEGK